MHKFRLYFDKDKEEIFLNDMAEQGYAMEKFFLGYYTFSTCEPGEYTYRVDIIHGKTIGETNAFYDLVREAGGELVQTWGFWAFFRKKGSFELYTDQASRIGQYEKIRKTFLLVALFELIITMQQWSLYFGSSHRGFFNLFLTGLITLITGVLFTQVVKCTMKIRYLKSL